MSARSVPAQSPDFRAPHGFAGHLVDFVEALRARGVPVGPSETVDAGRVLTVLDLMDREAVREGLACALLRRTTHRGTYDGLFDLWFPVAIGARTDSVDDVEIPRTPSGTVDIAALRELLAELLTEEGTTAQLESLAGQMVEELGQYQSARGPSFSTYQALKEVQPQTLLAKILAGLARPDASAFESEVARRAARQRIDAFRATVDAETRRRVAERIGRERVASYGVSRQAEEVDFLRASESELAELRRSSQRLARILAARLAVRRRHSRRGEIDLRRTLRKSMSTGGVPIDLVNRKPRPGRPELVLLCDVSGSVAGFSNFTLLLVSALREQFSRVRIFAFVDQTDEVTRFFDARTQLDEAMKRVFTEAEVAGFDGHSDYGSALSGFATKWPDAVTSRSSLLILGDARTNYRDPDLETLRELVQVAKHAHWLNPEPRTQWGSGDSAADKYQQVIEMHECRSAAQLTAVVSRLLPV
ncbi:VWA domain-containing protein [Nocardia cyriacigeorgica]|uniref:vWA domain-containing protein n=1 Tax=Nocardia cyriacigeorgica TaxID=135487 RepID=UPI0018960F81|nr:VWA domain-containing protein [Nocardia cyriacigeorgica]MBF6089314.1 VWA domain-containing protein [Nocardia cyriacigeorgica]MBF6093826.1 VWA domain-containing protein [Nocardia cyriacigeorgica]MBF6324985.1 VWA domain-containing protein [Nocardia cyriacigeorgica]MBF6398174.1 VWA domain-containing protein [Nocardia cyriacigeorgica]MBF6404312.1 VWA domain-containing protein [Nocardia cyriacigeorgica]